MHILICIKSIDAAFVPSYLRAGKIGPIKCGKGNKIMIIIDENSRLLSVIFVSGQSYEIKCFEGGFLEKVDTSNKTGNYKLIGT